jgi:hypothetical protein
LYQEVFLRFVVALLWASVLAGTLSARQAAQLPPTAATPEDQSPSANPITTLAQQFLEHDFFNFYVFANGVYDSEPLTLNGRSINEGGLGFDGGGGVNAFKQFKDGYLSLGYRGDYRDYSSSFFPSGTDQSLSFSYQKALTRRWILSLDTNAGIFLYGGTFFAPEPSQVNYVQTNPFSSESKFLSSGISLSYRATRRLTYVLNGQFYINRYNLPGSIGSTGVTGSASVLYRTTARTTVGGIYSHTYFGYQQQAGQLHADSVAATLSHIFSDHWYASASAGMTRTDSSGTVRVPVLIVNGNNLLPGYALGHYDRVSTFPSVQGTVSHQLRRSMLSISGGQGIAAGNGVFLASRNVFLDGFYSYSTRRSNLSFGGGISRLNSVANNVSFHYKSSSFSASYAYTVMRHIGANFRYDFVDYGSLGGINSRADNRVSFGVYFTSKTVPLTLF